MNKNCKTCYWCEKYDDIYGNWAYICLKYDIYIEHENNHHICSKYLKQSIDD